MMDGIEDKIKRVERNVNDPTDLEVIREWRDTLRLSFEREKYFDLKETKDLIRFIKNRIKDCRLTLSSSEGLEKVDNLALHARLKELVSMLDLLAKDPRKERRQLEAEIDRELQNV